jgi:HEAT repeat protein
VVPLLATVAVGLGAAAALFVLLLVSRRLLLARRERVAGELEVRVRPLALALLDGEGVPFAAALGTEEARALGRVLVRYGRQVRGGGQERISAFFADRGYVAEALGNLQARRAWRRAAAASALGDMGAASATGELLRALHDPSRDVRAAAARALGRLGATDAAPALVRTLASGAVSRVTAGQALLALGPAAVEAMRPMISGDDAAVRATAIEIIGLAGDGTESPLLIARLQDPSAGVRAAACGALGRLGAEEAAEALRRTLGDRIPFVRAAAADALGQIGDQQALTALAIQAHRDAFEPAAAAARALGRIAPRAAALAAAAPGAGPHLVGSGDHAALRRTG